MTRAREQLLMTHRTHDGETEAEPVVARLDHGRLTLTLDDGDIVELDATEVRSMLDETPRAA